MTEKEIVKVIKRINERMAVYQRQGLTDSIAYKKMKDKIELLEIPNSETKGRFKISMKKSDIAKIDTEDLKTLDNMPSLKEERKQAREKGYKTTKEQNEYIINRGTFEKWAEENLDQIYIDAKSGLNTAQKIKDLFQEKGKGQGTRNTDYNTIWKLVDKWNEQREEMKAELTKSNFHKNDIHGDK